jgi:lipopolysaccharide/colanic/teichoic acid biosynthesis glycosyltransferase
MEPKGAVRTGVQEIYPPVETVEMSDEMQPGLGSVEKGSVTSAASSTVKKHGSSNGNGKRSHAMARSSRNPSTLTQDLLSEDLFLGMLCLERKRAERSGKKLLLLLLDAEDCVEAGRRAEILKKVVKSADAARRETDPLGWYRHDSVLGIIFTQLGALDDAATRKTLLEKVHKALAVNLSVSDMAQVHITIHVFSEDSDDQGPNISENPAFYPDLFHLHDSRKASFLIKRLMDIAGSFMALILFSPVFLLIAIAVKLTSKGPVFFTQERLGQFGKKFTCLKFRSMYANNDLKIHKEFMKRVISGDHDGRANGAGKPVYKMTDDPRITRVGRFLRRTSLDELPQFLNVLKGEMSLVGPRPPLAYEYEVYDVWHRGRVLEIKPGITGLWQVKGRSRVRFDDMVRLDLQYARGWSLWVDIQILIQTPRAVLFGDGAY